MNEEQEVRYSRHILLKDLGYEGQDKIANSHVLVIGALNRPDRQKQG